MREDVRQRLIEAAKQRRLVCYGELMRDFRLARGRHIADVLCEISQYEHDRECPVLSAIVVKKQGLKPSGGFWEMSFVSRNIPWEQYRDEVYRHWSKASP
jgi:hypothetical protein